VGAKVKVIADRTVAAMSDFVCGANEEGYHLAGVNWARDLPEPQVADIRNVVAGDLSPDGKGRLEIVRGIEVGHIFQLRTKYSDAMDAKFLDAAGVEKPFEMGCYGIGITRIVAAAIRAETTTRAASSSRRRSRRSPCASCRSATTRTRPCARLRNVCMRNW